MLFLAQHRYPGQLFEGQFEAKILRSTQARRANLISVRAKIFRSSIRPSIQKCSVRPSKNFPSVRPHNGVARISDTPLMPSADFALEPQHSQKHVQNKPQTHAQTQTLQNKNNDVSEKASSVPSTEWTDRRTNGTFSDGRKLNWPFGLVSTSKF